MQVLALSGSARTASTNTAMLRAVAAAAPPGWSVDVFADVHRLPVFSPDIEADLPAAISAFTDRVAACDGILVASPEYAHAIPGGLKNAIDWLVGGGAVIGKPIALLHASHRGEDLLAQLRLVLGTISDGFQPDTFLRFSLMKLAPAEIAETLARPAEAARIAEFLDRFAKVAGRV
ncbi:NAD(P)H-dependent oxidoreductase [Paracoccus suum]|uniref:NAD(P)H-dependent oxidoreductase n=1 Tax=Paracoccus suum TaxID=2259340 RepID=A0A344PGL8_9RHOB|nr:NADPH-dependent FMN reductase [Paracoccus suum]AXC48523.1 NAD(P)H-dependent oxidoreductase [Paracoccus suum]